MEQVLREIERGLEGGHHYLALVTALTIPDICGALGASNGRATEARYMAWYEEHVWPRHAKLTPKHCYLLRCGVVHQARSPRGHEVAPLARVHFSLPDQRGTRFVNSTVAGAITEDAAEFCHDMVNAARSWLASKGADPTVQRNLEHVLQFYPNGRSPYVTGVPFIG